jgi:3-oxoacyl-[acyl-carrier protein] reductase
VKLKDRGVIVTGASQGLGKAIAQACVEQGAHVMICARDNEMLAQARLDLESRAQSGQVVGACCADVTNQDDVAKLFHQSAQQLPSIDGLVNNAGVYGPKGLLEDVDIMAWWKAIETNLLGVALTCRAVLPIFRNQKHGKIVNLSGGGATAPFPRISAYGASKAAVVRLTETLAHETIGAGIDVNALAPGALNTRMLDEVLAEGPNVVGADFYSRAMKQKEQGGAGLERGAELAVFLLSAESDGITGRLISAIWDPWRSLSGHAQDLRGTDVYTLRRIVPADRNLNWDEPCA